MLDGNSSDLSGGSAWQFHTQRSNPYVQIKLHVLKAIHVTKRSLLYWATLRIEGHFFPGLSATKEV